MNKENNKKWIYIVLISVFALYVLFGDNNKVWSGSVQRDQIDPHNKITEGFNEQNGQFCTTCRNKTLGQCLKCFNCGYCVDKFGRGTCIGGDYTGPYNFERCSKYYNTISSSMCDGKDKSCHKAYKTDVDDVFPSKNKEYYLWHANMDERVSPHGPAHLNDPTGSSWPNNKDKSYEGSGGSCYRWYHTDPFSYMLQRNSNYCCNGSPKCNIERKNSNSLTQI
jgi:hypothetical protein